MGMIGGGMGAFIGAVHRKAAAMDGLIELSCGAFSNSPEKSKASGKELGLPESRVYPDFRTMIEQEKKLPADQRMHFVSIVTPNFAHFEPAMLALENGFHVVIEKPMTFTLEEARQLAAKVKETGLLLCLTHTYAGYPMVKQARYMVEQGLFGKIRKVYVEYPQGWLSELSEKEGNAQAAWRTDPTKSGKAGAMGDIGTHAAHLAEYITGQKIQKLSADIQTIVPGRALDDDGAALLRFDSGASGVLIATQVAAGEENNLSIRVYGEKGGLSWRQMEPNSLEVLWQDKPKEVYRAGQGYLSPVALHNCRTPAGHPEGYIEAFANLYRNFALTLQARLSGEEPDTTLVDFPDVEDGVRGMAFIDNIIASGKSDSKWTDFKI
ncbi:Gfo/Idh/MocA family oxidoreductase [Arachidicoccus ginsenosidivorans]|uniref:Gfo/Idh/MocA family oxidoreductase n=2 Tax=Arachidicoccus ginsenosidivorans TaxID=496057 RepID=A0A5B8VSG9_9BACT|nr:Gfo/Idh/MocA family oxidoreductase [Arachidicoccus ginsenosidivorans]